MARFAELCRMDKCGALLLMPKVGWDLSPIHRKIEAHVPLRDYGLDENL